MIPYLRIEDLKNHTLLGGKYLYSPYMGVQPLPRAANHGDSHADHDKRDAWVSNFYRYGVPSRNAKDPLLRGETLTYKIVATDF